MSRIIVLIFLLAALGACRAQPDVQRPLAMTETVVPRPVDEAPFSRCGVRSLEVLGSDDIRVEVCPAPFSYTLLTPAGEVLLRSRRGRPGSGFGGVAHGDGSLDLRAGRFFHQLVKRPGERAEFESWTDEWQLVTLTSESAFRVALELVSADGQLADVVLTVRPGAVRVEASLRSGAPRFWATAFDSPRSEGFLGFGERFTRTDLRGLDVPNWAEEGGFGAGEKYLPGPSNPVRNGETMTYYPVPFFVSTQGYGFWLDSSWYSEFNLATIDREAWRVWHAGPTLAFEVYFPSAGDRRPWPYQVIDRFTEATGRPMLPPDWAYGPRRRISSGSTICPDLSNDCDEDDRIHEVEAHRLMDLPLTGVDDAFHFLPKGHAVGRPGSRKQWTRKLDLLGYQSNAYFNPYLSTDPKHRIAPLVQDGLSRGWFIRDGRGRPIEAMVFSGGRVDMVQVDFTDPDQSAWYGDFLTTAFDEGYQGWMYDFGEYVPAHAVGADGSPGEQLHNLYPVLYQKAAFAALEKSPRAGNWLTFARSGFTGSSQYTPFVWSGDPTASFGRADGLGSMIPAGLNLSISGAPNWGGDIGGFHCLPDDDNVPDEELMVRWIQLGALTPNMQDQSACPMLMGGERDKPTIWTSSLMREAWARYAGLHTRLQPYFLPLAREAHRTGAPIMRHLFLDHPTRRDLAGVMDTFYLGRDILVAPVVVRGARSRRVEIVADKHLVWIRGRERVVSPGQVTVEAPLSEIPLLLRDGAIVPLLDDRIDTLFDETNPDVIGPDDVSDIYDVVAFLTEDREGSTQVLANGGTLGMRWVDLVESSHDSEAFGLSGVFRKDGELEQRRVTIPAHTTWRADGIELRNDTERQTRWHIYLQRSDERRRR